MIVRLQLPSYFSAFRKMLAAVYSSTTPNSCHSRFLETRDPTRGPIWEPMTTLLAVVYIIDAVWLPAFDNVTFRLYAGGKACLLEPDGKSIADADLGFLYVCIPVRLGA